MGIEISAQTSGGPEAGGSAHQKSTAEIGTSGAQDHKQGPPEQQWTVRLAPAGPLELRSERIAAIQAAIANGTYQVSPEQTAEAILAEHVVRDESAA
jgi:anti-sigma28 factor (negative regulator of flagellin synthesis)